MSRSHFPPCILSSPQLVFKSMMMHFFLIFVLEIFLSLKILEYKHHLTDRIYYFDLSLFGHHKYAYRIVAVSHPLISCSSFLFQYANLNLNSSLGSVAQTWRRKSLKHIPYLLGKRVKHIWMVEWMDKEGFCQDSSFTWVIYFSIFKTNLYYFYFFITSFTNSWTLKLKDTSVQSIEQILFK